MPHVHFQVYCHVEPKRQALAQTNLDLAAATEKLEAIRRKLMVSVTSHEEVPTATHCHTCALPNRKDLGLS